MARAIFPGSSCKGGGVGSFSGEEEEGRGYPLIKTALKFESSEASIQLAKDLFPAFGGEGKKGEDGPVFWTVDKADRLRKKKSTQNLSEEGKRKESHWATR